MFSAIKLGALGMVFLSAAVAGAQNNKQSSGNSEGATLTVNSNLVIVPALVKTKSGEPAFSLTADDFILTDDGIPQPLRLESGTDSQPLALAIVVETGGCGASHLPDYRGLGAVLDAVIGDVPHQVAVIGFDSRPYLVKDFTPDTDAAADAIAVLREGDQGAAILDALGFSIDLLRKQPSAYRRAILFFGETVDRDSQTSLEDTLRAVGDTNTSIYSFAFSSPDEALKHEASKLPRPEGTPYSDKPYAPGGCMSRDPNADPDARGNRRVQALDCASDLLPPLRLARMAFLAATYNLRRNVPRSVAQLTGGEYFTFKNARTLRQDLIVISNDVPNHYVLSFRPQSPHSGLHTLELRLKNRPDLNLQSRNAYWVDTEPAVTR